MSGQGSVADLEEPVVVTVPTLFADLLPQIDPELPGVQVRTWDMNCELPGVDEIELVFVPPFGAAWVKRLDELPRLRGVITLTAGYEHVQPHVPSGVPLANAVGVHDTATAELGLGLLIAAQRELPEMVRAQEQGQWLRPRVRRSLADSRALVLGYGGVGRALTRRLHACEVSVTAVASRSRGGDDLVDQVHGVDDLPDLLPHHDVLAITLPGNSATAGLVDASVLAALPDDALVLNIGRGSVLDTDALVQECGLGRLRAALDVTDPEPLPAEHPLWSTPGVTISPHTGGSSEAFPRRGASYIRDQIKAHVTTGSIDNVVYQAGA